MLSLNSKYVQHVKIYLACNFKVIWLLTSWTCFHLHLTSISYSFWNKGWKVLTFLKFDVKRTITWRWVIRFTLKFQAQLGHMEPNLAESIYVRSKPGIDGPWVCPFQNCVRQPHPLFKMAAVFLKVMIISLWHLLQYHSIIRWAIQAQ
jgi:hypothetical protein